MKKSLFAVAALSAIAGAAQAQSSVTVYGILDAGYIGSNQTASATSSATTIATSAASVPNNVNNNGAQIRTVTNQMGQSAESTSRLGFKGNEDLGGGTSAFFTVEMGLNPQLGNLSGSSAQTKNNAYDWQGTSNTSGSAIDNRQSFVGVKKAGIGQIAFGRQYTPVFNVSAATSPGQHNNIVGDVMYAGSTVVSEANAGQYYLSGFTNRADNQLSFASDKFAGFGVSGMYVLNNTNATVVNPNVAGTNAGTGTTTGGNSNWSGWGIGADYTWQKLFVSAATQQFRTKIDNVAAASTTIGNTNGAPPLAGQTLTTFVPGISNLTDKQSIVAGTYDFGILKASLQWANRSIAQNTTITTGYGPGQVMKRSAQQIGVRSYITPTIEAWASAGNGKVTPSNAATNIQYSSNNFTAYQLGANYYLSKRTNLYGIYGSTQTTSATVGNPGSGSSASQYALGMRHTF